MYMEVHIRISYFMYKIFEVTHADRQLAIIFNVDICSEFSVRFSIISNNVVWSYNWKTTLCVHNMYSNQVYRSVYIILCLCNAYMYVQYTYFIYVHIAYIILLCSRYTIFFSGVMWCIMYTLYRNITFNEKTWFLPLSDNLNVLYMAATNRIGNDEKYEPVKLCFILENWISLRHSGELIIILQGPSHNFNGYRERSCVYFNNNSRVFYN